jgi:hypothetical protein
MYIDRHEREDVVNYHKKFVERWKEYKKRFMIYDNEGQVVSQPQQGFAVPGVWFCLILVTHDESTFYENDRRKTKWVHKKEKAVAEKKEEGQLIMASDFLTVEWGSWEMVTSTCIVRIFHLKGFNFGVSEAQVIFKAGKNRDGWFSCKDLLQQVDMAIDIFEGKTNGFATGLFLFDNTPSHQKGAPDALSARKMPKNPHPTWTHHKEGPKMRMTWFGEDQRIQDLYFDHDHPTMPGWFKGMEIIIRERGLWLEKGMNAQCDEFKCVAGKTNCCCRRLLFTQPDFVA